MNLAAMKPENRLTSTGYCLANAAPSGAEYLVYLPDGGTADVDLAGTEGVFAVKWFKPRTGGAKGAVGQPLVEPHDDWLAVIRFIQRGS